MLARSFFFLSRGRDREELFTGCKGLIWYVCVCAKGIGVYRGCDAAGGCGQPKSQ